MRNTLPVDRDVSRETLQKLKGFEGLVRKWSPRINLVSPADLDDFWGRHIVDCAQLASLSDTPERWLDLGSGSGLPGLVIAILLEGQASHVTLVESDRRKCAFLKTAARILGLSVDVLPMRIEALRTTRATTLSARALAPLDKLVEHAHAYLAREGTALFPKGRNWKIELEAAKVKWSFDCDMVQSVTDRDAAILRLCNITRI